MWDLSARSAGCSQVLRATDSGVHTCEPRQQASRLPTWTCRLQARALGDKADPWRPPYAVWDFSTGDLFVEPACALC